MIEGGGAGGHSDRARRPRCDPMSSVSRPRSSARVEPSSPRQESVVGPTGPVRSVTADASRVLSRLYVVPHKAPRWPVLSEVMLDAEHRRRDAGLRRVTILTRATIVGGLALTGGLSVVAAHASSGSSSKATTSLPADGLDPAQVVASDPASA